MTPDPEQLSDEPVRLARRTAARDEPWAQDVDDDSSWRQEMLDSRPEPVWRPSRWLVVTVVVMVLIATAGWYADRQERTREMGALQGCRRQLHEASVFADTRLMAMADYLAPALAMMSGTRRAQLASNMSSAARSVLGDVERADRVCRAVSIRPWHFTLVSEHRAATAYSGALAARVRSIVHRGISYYRDDPALQRLRAAAGIHVGAGPF